MSLVVVGHTMTTYYTTSSNNSHKWTLGCNILWAIVLGTPNAQAVAAANAARDAGASDM
jgi:hypothetical protein